MRKDKRNHDFHTTGMERRRNRMRNHREGECKCLTPFVKLHLHDCPLVKKPCPVHGSSFDNGLRRKKKEGDGESEEFMLLSFHPSIKTDGLFQPLLSSRDPETQINFRYFPSKESVKEMFKHRQIQTNSEDLKPPMGNKYFVEKAKSYVADKTNRMKKLKQCFYSPCNSIVQKTRSQTSIRPGEISHDEPKRMCNASVGERPSPRRRRRASDDTNIDPSWFCGKLASSDGERSSGLNLTDSDRFFAVARPFKNPDFFNSNSLDMRHHKGSGEVQFFKKNNKGEWALHFFTPADSDYHVNYMTDMSAGKENDNAVPVENKNLPSELPKNEEENKKGSYHPLYSYERQQDRKTKSSDESFGSSGKSQTDSSDSVYYTPFILVPAGKDDRKPERKPDVPKDDKCVQAFVDTSPQKRDVSVSQTPPLSHSLTEEPDEINVKDTADDSFSAFEEKPKEEEKVKGSIVDSYHSYTERPDDTGKRKSYDNYSYKSSKLPSIEHVEEVKHTRPDSKTPDVSPPRSFLVEELDERVKASQTSLGETPYLKHHKSVGLDSGKISDVDRSIVPVRGLPEKATVNVGLQVAENELELDLRRENLNNRGVQTSLSYLCNTQLIERYEKGEGKKNEATQTSEKKFRDAQIEAPKMTMKTIQTQTTFSSSKRATETDAELEDLNKITISSTTYDQPNASDQVQVVETTHWWQKSHSDGEVYGKKKCEAFVGENEETGYCRCHCNQPSTSFPSKDKCACWQNKLTTIMEPVGTDARNPDESNQCRAVKMHEVEMKDEGNCTSLYDLSDLTRIINDQFQKMFEDPKRHQKCPRTACVDREIMTDCREILTLDIARKEASIQTSFREVTKSWEQVNFQQSLLLDLTKPTTNFLICKTCKQNLNIIFVDACTSTNEIWIPANRTKSIDSDVYSELIELEKVPVQTWTPMVAEPAALKAIESPRVVQPNQNEITSWEKSRNKPPITLPKNQKLMECDQNRKPVERDTKVHCPTPLPRKNVLFQSPLDCKRLESCGAQGRTGEFTTIKDSPTLRPLNSQSRPKTSTSNRDQSGCKCPRPSVRAPRATPGQNPICPSGTLNPTSSTAGRADTARLIPSTNPSPSTSCKDKPKSRTDRFAYNAWVLQQWPKQLIQNFQDNGTKKSKNEFSLDSSGDSATSSFQQKRNFDKENDLDDNVPVGKKIRSEEVWKFDLCGKSDPEEECFVFGQHERTYSDANFRISTKVRPRKSGLERNSSFVCGLPPNSVEYHFSNLNKDLRAVTQSERKTNFKEETSQKRCPSCQSLASKSMCFRSAVEEMGPRGLYKCPKCKTLSYLKDSKEDSVTYIKFEAGSRHKSKNTSARLPVNENSWVVDSDAERTQSSEWDFTTTTSRDLEENNSRDL